MPDFKIGDYIYYRKYGFSGMAKIERIEERINNKKLWGKWRDASRIPKTVHDFENVIMHAINGWMPDNEVELLQLKD